MVHSRPLYASSGACAAPDPGQLSKLIWHIYDGAQAGDVSAFIDQATTMLDKVVGFSGVWLGCDVRTGSGHRVHGSHLLNLPDDAQSILNTTDPWNNVVTATRRSPNRARIFGEDVLFATPASAALSRHIGAHELIGIAEIDQATGVSNFIAMIRGQKDPAFNDVHRQWLELLMPHLTAGFDHCCGNRIARWRADCASARVFATADEAGFIYLSDPGLSDLLRQEWPDWPGRRLPRELVARFAAGRRGFDGKVIHADFHWSGQRVFIAFRQALLRDRLTPKELEVAQAFASGQSYKEVARRLGLAPATVRHHLRSAYLRLGVTDKAALANAVGRDNSLSTGGDIPSRGQDLAHHMFG